ncbi:hypothetical protein [Paenibacillus sp. NPDC058177]|uniref:hypothetical protein n=1 Tax=Paenibacillus sp. NPDC058177 TaxID=3346369 RepID=UPI0036DCF452
MRERTNAAGLGRYPMEDCHDCLRQLKQGGITTHSSLTNASFCFSGEGSGSRQRVNNF